mmetsp:Transcript_48077/g.124626  ORF Transcript_48077/g.124626 Transcript_48077/m.124626 type:complete len:246 (-) Transcript_48077:1736-2473(-)
MAAICFCSSNSSWLTTAFGLASFALLAGAAGVAFFGGASSSSSSSSSPSLLSSWRITLLGPSLPFLPALLPFPSLPFLPPLPPRPSPWKISILALVRAPNVICRSSSADLRLSLACLARSWRRCGFCFSLFRSFSFFSFWICAAVLISFLAEPSTTESLACRFLSCRFCLWVRCLASTWPWKGTTGLRFLPDSSPSPPPWTISPVLSKPTVLDSILLLRPPRWSTPSSSSPTFWMRLFDVLAHFL